MRLSHMGVLKQVWQTSDEFLLDLVGLRRQNVLADDLGQVI